MTVKPARREIAKRICTELGKQTPWHVTGYYPAYRESSPPTPVSTLEIATLIGKEEGLDFVYLGNVPGHPYEHTYCPKCGELLIKRDGFSHSFTTSETENVQNVP
jgi:pyruvate formate lyase activating enzyme